MERAFQAKVGVSVETDFADPAWIASEYAHVLSAVDGPSSLRNDAQRDVEAALGRPIQRSAVPLAGTAGHGRDGDWSLLGKRLGVQMPRLEMKWAAAVGSFVLVVGLFLLCRKFLPRETWPAVWRLPGPVTLLLIWAGARTFVQAPWSVRTEEQIVSHVVVERAAVLPEGHVWTLGEIADVVAAVTDVPHGRRPFSATDAEALFAVAAAVALVGGELWHASRVLK